jgi:hypothetical protein
LTGSNLAGEAVDAIDAIEILLRRGDKIVLVCERRSGSEKTKAEA